MKANTCMYYIINPRREVERGLKEWPSSSGRTSNVQGLFLGYFGHNYEVFWGLFRLKYISKRLTQIWVAPKFLWKFNIEVAPKPEM